jgi:hypothetical protein
MISTTSFAIVAALAVFGGGALGFVLQRTLPESLTTGGPRDMIGAVVGLLTLLSALVLGLLIWTAYGVYASQTIQNLAAKAMQFDFALADYGPETRGLRLQLRDGLSKTINEVWGANVSNGNFIAENFSAAIRNLHDRQAALDKLHPTNDDQPRALAAANSAAESIAQSRLLMSFGLWAPISLPLVETVVVWFTLIFVGFGLTSKGNPTSIVVAIVGALAVASAFHLILDLSQPYTGVFRASPAPLTQVLAAIGKE